MHTILKIYFALVAAMMFVWSGLYFGYDTYVKRKIVTNFTATIRPDAFAMTTKLPTPPPVVTSLDGRNTSFLRPSNDFLVPNIVHFIWFGQSMPMKFHHMLSMLSAHKYVKPDAIWLHCDHEPVGPWWNYLTKSLKVPLKITRRSPPRTIFDKKIVKPEHQADVARMEILLKHGGIYLDTDVIALKSFDPLRKFNMTMGIEYHGRPGRLNNGILVAQPNATFLRIWQSTYRNFTAREWDYHSCILTYNLQFVYPNLIHVEENTLNYPDGKHIDLIYKRNYDWSKNYAIHLWHRLYKRDVSNVTIRTMNSTYGQIARYVYYGSPTLLVGKIK